MKIRSNGPVSFGSVSIARPSAARRWSTSRRGRVLRATSACFGSYSSVTAAARLASARASQIVL
jgi:hypothetical protein